MKQKIRVGIVAAVAAALAVSAPQGIAQAKAGAKGSAAATSAGEAYPTRPVRMIVASGAGGGLDFVARLVAPKMTEGLGQQVVVDNRAGAGQRLAMGELRHAAPNGQTLLLATSGPFSIYPHIYSKLSYDPTKDFVPVSIAAVMHHGLAVGPLVPASVKNVKDFLAWAKANPGQANYGSPAAGSTPHFIGALLGLNNGVDLKHVPYRGSIPGVTDVVGGQIASMVTPSGDFIPNHKAGKLRLIATSGQARSPFSPEVPTFAEQGFPELTTEEWFGFYAPAKTPASVVAAANAAINMAIKEKSVIDSLAVVGLIAKGSTAAEMAASQQAEADRWGPLVKKIGFTAES